MLTVIKQNIKLVLIKGLIKLRLRVDPHFSSGIVERAKRERARKSPHARKGDTPRGMIFTRARVSHALLYLRKNGGLLVVYIKLDKIATDRNLNLFTAKIILCFISLAGQE